MLGIKKKLSLGLLILSLLIFTISGINALNSWFVESERDNLFTTGNLTAAIIEDFQQSQVIYPGETIDKRVNVTNTGEVDSLIRVKVEKVWGQVGDSGEFLPDSTLPTDNILISFNTAAWLQIGDYHHYLGVLHPGETTYEPLFTEVYIASSTGNNYANKQAQVVVVMESVQAAYGGPSVWGLTLEDLGVEYSPPETVLGNPQVTFESPQEKFTFTTGNDDILCAWEDLIPGESRSQFVIVQNKYSAKVPISIRAEQNYLAPSPEEQALVDHMLEEYVLINIVDETGATVYRGPLGGRLDAQGEESMKDYISLGEFQPQQARRLYVSIHVSPLVDKRYSNLMGKITWLFQASGAESEYPPKTGDTFNMTLYALLMVFAIVIFIVSVVMQRRIS